MNLPNHRFIKNSCQRMVDFLSRYHEEGADQALGIKLIKRESSVLLKAAFKFWLKMRIRRS